MNGIQKTIKIIAICLAITIIVSIFSCLFYFLFALSNITEPQTNNTKNNEPTNSETYNNNITNIELDVAFSDITIKSGSEFKVETNDVNNSYSAKEKNNTLEIEEEKIPFGSNNGGEITIYIPKNTILNKLSIDKGAGNIEITDITSNKIEVENGAGQLLINNSMFNNTEIDGGAGNIEITNSTLNNLEMDSGVGEVNITSKITGISEISCGVGNVNINITGTSEEYTIRTEKGLGSIKINNEEITSNNTYGTGNNKLKVEGGVGNITIDFQS